MRHLILLFSLLLTVGIAGYFSWLTLHEPGGRIEEITNTERKVQDMEFLSQQLGFQIVETETVFDSENSFKEMNKNLGKADDLSHFLPLLEPSIFHGRIKVSDGICVDVYYTQRAFYVPRASYLPWDWFVSSDGKLYRETWNNAWLMGLLIAAEVGAAMGIFFLVEKVFFAHDW